MSAVCEALGAGFSFQVTYTLLNQRPMPFPFKERVLQQLDEALCLGGVATGVLQGRKQFLLAAQPFATLLDIAIRLEQMHLLNPELLGRIGR